MKIISIVQARMGSTRFPNKVMQPITGKPMIELLLQRLSMAQGIDQIVLATSNHTSNQPLIAHVERLGYQVYEGSENDVLDRYYQAACIYQPDVVIRITGDCPLIDPIMVDAMINQFKQSNADYLTNTCPPTFPDGLDISIFTFEALQKAHSQATKPYDREHVTPYIRECSLFTIHNYSNNENFSEERWTVDEPEDLEVVSQVFEHFHPRLDFTWLEVMSLRRKQPELFVANKHLMRNEGSVLGTGQKLWKRAKRVIPGGNMLLSKRAEMFLPDQWPAYFSRAQSCRVWDLDNREYIDTSIMGIGTNTLGYGHPEVDEAVRQGILSGNMSTFNCPEEVSLAEKLVELHPWADMVRFARSGGEANAIAVRIARAAAGKEKVAICGYHGWHDWYLAANLDNEQSLVGHLLPGLEPKGVPKSLKDTVFPFRYNCFDELIDLVSNQDIGVIKMEVRRNEEPKDKFLEKVRQLATERGIVLIFDECTSGFRQTLGGLHKFYGVDPDIAMFGKALGNGYAITAVLGRREVMEFAQSTFISSTFWTERIGPVAALKTLEVMEKLRSWETITAIGESIGEGWKKLGQKYDLPIQVFGLPALIKFRFKSPHNLAYKTLITQEMLKRGYLAGNSVYVCIDHTPEILSGYFEALADVFGLIADCEQGRNVIDFLEGPICHSSFKRLN
jgi:glutamate-1-semialdehyde 2,1-aminomutase